ncbi:hypothetical protein ACRRTK_010641 [Alexandromys fortis]
MSTTLRILWFRANEISLDWCIVQMFFLHGFTCIESGVLVAMAFDRYIAICNPLRYTTILTNSRIIQMGFLVIMRAIVLIVPLLLLLKLVSFCRVITLSHSYCYHPDVIKLACSDTRANSICGLVDLLLTTGVDTPSIVLSYILIIRSVLTIASSGERYKVFSTCVSHIGAVAILYIPMFSLSLVHRYVYDGIHQWRHKQENVSHEDLGYRRTVFGKAVDNSKGDDRDIEDKHSTDVGDTGAEDLEPFPLGCNAQHCSQDQSIGQENTCYVQDTRESHK